MGNMTPNFSVSLFPNRSLVLVAATALALVILAIGASLFQLQHDRDVRHQYQDTLELTHVAFDAGSLAARMRALPPLAVNEAADSGVLRAALRAIEVDAVEWDRRMADVMGAQMQLETRTALAQLRTAIGNMRTTVRRQAAAGSTDGVSGALQSGVAALDLDAQYLASVEAAQTALLASVRAGVEHAAVAGYTISEISSAVIAGASVVALLLGALLLTQVQRSQHESRAAIGAMGELLRTDPLTGISNRRSLDENLPVEMARARRGNTTLTVAMLDLDYFKRYNSRRGHAGGDSLLRTAAQSWRRQLRPTDTLVRYGGEEFTLVLPNCGAEQACQLIDRLRPVLPDNQTFSAGVACWDYAESGDELLRRADRALLLAKKQGRNRTIVSGQEEQIALSFAPPSPVSATAPLPLS